MPGVNSPLEVAWREWLNTCLFAGTKYREAFFAGAKAATEIINGQAEKSETVWGEVDPEPDAVR